MKHIFILIFFSLLIIRCSSSIDTTNLGPEEKLAFAIKLYQDEDYEEAVKEFEAIIIQYPGSSILDDAQYYLAMTRYKRGEYILAAYQFSKLIKSMPSSEFLADSQFMLAECYYELSPHYTLDQQYTKKAIEEYQAFIDFFPLNEKISLAENKIKELNDKLAKKEYESSRIYTKMDYYTAAFKYLDNVMELYHDTQYAPLALYDKIKLLLERERESDALAESKKFLEKFPFDGKAQEVEGIKNSLEGKLSANQQ
jgi:outer membrane protein assembly factor BamD